MHWACSKISASLAISDATLLEILLDKVDWLSSFVTVLCFLILFRATNPFLGFFLFIYIFS